MRLGHLVVPELRKFLKKNGGMLRGTGANLKELLVAKAGMH